MRTRAPAYRMGSWLVVCDRCGGTRYHDETQREWTGLRVCKSCLDPKHPQETIYGKSDRQAPPWSRPRPADIDVSPGSGNEVTKDDVV